MYIYCFSPHAGKASLVGVPTVYVDIGFLPMLGKASLVGVPTVYVDIGFLPMLGKHH